MCKGSRVLATLVGVRKVDRDYFDAIWDEAMALLGERKCESCDSHAEPDGPFVGTCERCGGKVSQPWLYEDAFIQAISKVLPITSQVI